MKKRKRVLVKKLVASTNKKREKLVGKNRMLNFVPKLS